MVYKRFFVGVVAIGLAVSLGGCQQHDSQSVAENSVSAPPTQSESGAPETPGDGGAATGTEGHRAEATESTAQAADIIIPECPEMNPLAQAEHDKFMERLPEDRRYDSRAREVSREEFSQKVGPAAGKALASVEKYRGCHWGFSLGTPVFQIDAELKPEAKASLIAALRDDPDFVEMESESHGAQQFEYLVVQEGVGSETVFHTFIGDMWICFAAASDWALDNYGKVFSESALEALIEANPGLGDG